MLEPEIKPNGNARKPETAFEKEVARKSKDNPKSFWKYVNTKLKYKDNVADLNTKDGIASNQVINKKQKLSVTSTNKSLPMKIPATCHTSNLENVILYLRM